MRHIILCSLILFLSVNSFADDGVASSTPAAADSPSANLGGILPAQVLEGASSFATGAASGLSTPEITAAAEAATKALLTTVDTSLTSVDTTLVPPYFSKSNTLVKSIGANIKAYVARKKMCTSSAEAAYFLCADGTSPGAKAVKTLMTVGAPILGMISSAQKACSTTADLTSLATKALTVAKGACIAAKTTCDMSCASSAEMLATINGQITNFRPVYFNEEQTTSGICEKSEGVGPGATACAAVAAASGVVTPQMASVDAALKKESAVVSPGTTSYIAAKCSNLSQDILVMAANILSLVNANKSASACSAQLATTGNPATTALQYCETPANTNTQFCICQKDNKQQGCPGYVATAANTPTTPTNDLGVDMKNGGKGNQFASGGLPVKPDSALNVGGLGSLGGDGTGSAADKAAADAAKSGTSLSAFGGASTGDSAGGSAPSADLSAGSDKNAADKKKWSFGAFSGFGGGGSGSGSGDSGSANSKNALGQKDMDSIKRQIASEQLRAEVSEASGKSNWEKVRTRYLQQSNSLLNGQ